MRGRVVWYFWTSFLLYEKGDGVISKLYHELEFRGWRADWKTVEAMGVAEWSAVDGEGLWSL